MKHSPLRMLAAAMMTLIVVAAPVSAQTATPLTKQSLRGLQKAVAAQSAVVYRPSEAVYLTHDGSDWIPERRTRTFYAGLEIRRQYRDVWQGDILGSFEESELTEHDHLNGRVVQTTEYERGDQGWEPVSRTAFRFEDALLTGQTTERWQGVWVPESRDEFTLSGGLIVGGVASTWTGADWDPVERFDLIEADGHVVETYQNFEFGAWTNTEQTVYANTTLADLHVRLADLLANLTDYEGLWFGLRFPDATSFTWSGQDWQPESKQTTNRTYDGASGRLLMEVITTDTWDGTQWAPEVRQFIEFVAGSGSEDVPALTTVDVAVEGGWLQILSETYVVETGIGRIVQATVSADFGAGVQDMSRISLTWVGLSTAKEEVDTPTAFHLAQNYPNPFNPTTSITYTLTSAQEVSLSVFDLMGREVARLDQGMRPIGTYSVDWDATEMASGMYLYRLAAAGQTLTRPMILLK